MLKQLILTFSLLGLGLIAVAADKAAKPYAAGTDYTAISPPVRSVDPDKIEVAEFFWYGCGHCYTFEPLLEQWKKNLPEDVTFRRIPAIWNDRMELHARAYYTAEALGVVDTLHPALFQAMNVDRKPLATQADIAALFKAHGVAEEDFNKTFTSFGVNSQVTQASALGKAAGMTGTPSLMVNGKYYISGGKGGTQADMLKVSDYLADKERSAKEG